jgi:L-lactate dehydrogenase complex protein LldG
MAGRARGPLPAPIDDLLARFRQECGVLATSVEEVSALSAVPSCVAAYLQQHSLGPQVVGWQALAGADVDVAAWHAAGVRYQVRPAQEGDAIGITDCFCAIAETGTLVLLGGATTPKATALLPETHVCIVSKCRVVPTMEDAFSLIRQERGELPRATFLVSGPSRTADIEQTIVIGAHGPYRVHVVLV